MRQRSATAPQSNAPGNQRRSDRLEKGFAGTLFLGDGFHACTVRDISQGGARVTCEHSLPLNARVRLHIEAFGSFECSVIRHESDEFGLLFIFNDAKRFHVIDKLAQFVQTGMTSSNQANRRERVAANAFACFNCADGYLVQCYILDISLKGMSVAVLVRPPIGEIISFGGTYGRVTRHHDKGVVVQFLNDAAQRQATAPGQRSTDGLYLSSMM